MNATAGRVHEISSGAFHTCATVRPAPDAGASPGSGWSIECWGQNYSGELGAQVAGASPSRVSGFESGGATSVVAGGAHSCAILVGGSVSCWGDNRYGQLGRTAGQPPSTYRTFPVGVEHAKALALGQNFSCALTTAGGVLCWGYGYGGTLGNGDVLDSSTPVQVTGLDSGVVAITANGVHACALKADRSVVCWGQNASGEGGDGSTTNALVPVAVAGLPPVRAVVAGYAHTCAISVDGPVYCWGDDSQGQLGFNSPQYDASGQTISHPNPTPVPAFGEVALVEIPESRA